MLAQHLRDREDEIRGGRSIRELPGETETDHFGEQHIDRLTDHDGLGFDATDAPSNNTQPVDHRRMRVGADERVRVKDTVVIPYDLGEILEVHLVNDSGGRRNDPEVVEGSLSPLEELVAFHVPCELHLGVDLQRIGRVERIDLHRVIDDEVGRDLRVDLGGGGFVSGHPNHRRPHRSEVDDGGNAGEVLENDAGRLVGDLRLPHLRCNIASHCMNVRVGDDPSIVIPERRLEENLDRIRQGIDVTETGEGIESIDRSFAERCVDRAPCSERIVGVGHGAASQTSRGRGRVESGT